MPLGLIDTGGRRTGIDRRDFSYTNYLPNRRVEEDRRSGNDRRSGLERRSNSDRRTGKSIFKKIRRPENDLREGTDRRRGQDRRATFTIAVAIWHFISFDNLDDYQRHYRTKSSLWWRDGPCGIVAIAINEEGKNQLRPGKIRLLSGRFLFVLR